MAIEIKQKKIFLSLIFGLINYNSYCGLHTEYEIRQSSSTPTKKHAQIKSPPSTNSNSLISIPLSSSEPSSPQTSNQSCSGFLNNLNITEISPTNSESHPLSPINTKNNSFSNSTPSTYQTKPELKPIQTTSYQHERSQALTQNELIQLLPTVIHQRSQALTQDELTCLLPKKPKKRFKSLKKITPKTSNQIKIQPKKQEITEKILMRIISKNSNKHLINKKIKHKLAKITKKIKRGK